MAKIAIELELKIWLGEEFVLGHIKLEMLIRHPYGALRERDIN